MRFYLQVSSIDWDDRLGNKNPFGRLKIHAHMNMIANRIEKETANL